VVEESLSHFQDFQNAACANRRDLLTAEISEAFPSKPSHRPLIFHPAEDDVAFRSEAAASAVDEEANAMLTASRVPPSPTKW
jgi:hypothetical protein